MATMQVRCFRSGRNAGASYHYFEGVTAHRAAELAAMYAAMRCETVPYMEVRDDAYPSLYDPPVLVARGDGTPIDSACELAAVMNQ